MQRILTSTLLWTIAVCLLVALIAPSTSIGQYAIKILVTGIVALAAISVFQLVSVFVMIQPDSTWKPGKFDQPVDTDDDDWVDDLTDGTAMGLIDWNE